MAQPDITTEDYWQNEFDVSPDEEINLQEMFMQLGRPLATGDLATYLMERRLSPAARRRAGDLAYHPTLHYEVGDVLHFPLLDNASGKVVAIRPGNNPRYGDFNVIEVQVQEGRRLFASDFAEAKGHYQGEVTASGEEVDPSQIIERYRGHVERQIEQVLEGDNFIRLDGSWLPRLMLVGLHEGHANLAEAIIEMLDEPQSSAALLPEMEIREEAGDEVKRFSLDYLLSHDGRFALTPSDGESRWMLTRLA